MGYQTQEKLKSYLDTDQLNRERLCLSIMQLDGRFQNIRPRHPRGGPDGGRDIEATYNSNKIVYAAVGFVNSANDSKEQKNRIFSKFKDDSKNALKSAPKPDVFVFFTNIDLTIKEKEKLSNGSLKIGFEVVDIFDREVIRSILDSVNGFSVRQQYLNIMMSEEEQIAFFSKWGNDINNLISDRMLGVEEKIDRILFFQEAQVPLETFTVKFILNRPYSSEELGHFRILTSGQLVEESAEIQHLLWLVGSGANRFKNSDHLHSEGHPKQVGTGSRAWVGRFEDIERDRSIFDAKIEWKSIGSSSSVGYESYSSVFCKFNHASSFFRYGKYLTLHDLDYSRFAFMVNESFVSKIASVEFYANGYLLDHHNSWDFEERKTTSKEEDSTNDPVSIFLDEAFSSKEKQDEWMVMSPGERGSSLMICFSERTPRKIYNSKRIDLPSDDNNVVNNL